MTMTRILHRRCGGHLFNYMGQPEPGQCVIPEKVRLLDGTTPTPGMILRCWTCTKLVSIERDCISEHWPEAKALEAQKDEQAA
jgi:hypothetical protein